MNGILSALLIIVAIIITIIILGLSVFAFFVYSMSLAAKPPSKKEIRHAIKNITGCDIGKEFDIVKMDYRFAHSDRPTHVIVKISERKFFEFLESCRDSANKEDETSLLVQKNIPEELLFQSVRFDKVGKLLHYTSQM